MDGILWACLILGVVVRYMMALSQGCLFVGRAISSDNSKTGFQDAITPPLSSTIALAAYGLSAALVIFAFWSGGLSLSGTAALSLVVFTFLAGFVVPKPNSAHWVRLIYRSMVNRTADYVKSGDIMRTDAAVTLTQRIEKIFNSAVK